MCLHLADYEDENGENDEGENDDEEDKHQHDDGNEGQWEGVADVPATSGATWLTP